VVDERFEVEPGDGGVGTARDIGSVTYVELSAAGGAHRRYLGFNLLS
jgi:hypothetical protein